MSDHCSYCGKKLGDKYKFSLGLPGIPQTFACNRSWCTIKRDIRRKMRRPMLQFAQKLKVFADRLAKWSTNTAKFVDSDSNGD